MGSSKVNLVPVYVGSFSSCSRQKQNEKLLNLFMKSSNRFACAVLQFRRRRSSDEFGIVFHSLPHPPAAKLLPFIHSIYAVELVQTFNFNSLRRLVEIS